MLKRGFLTIAGDKFSLNVIVSNVKQEVDVVAAPSPQTIRTRKQNMMKEILFGIRSKNLKKIDKLKTSTCLTFNITVSTA